MNPSQIIKSYNLALFVKDIFVLENNEANKKSLLPFFADGYPGIIFRQAENKVVLLPRKKRLSDFFLYGQTLKPIEISINGPYQLIVFQLYPFASKLLFGVDPKILNDDCHDLSKIKATNAKNPLVQINATSDKESRVRLIAGFLSKLAREKGLEEYREIQSAIQIIIDRKGLISVNETAKFLRISERTLQRKFKQYVGISPKKFAKIIQFQTSLAQISQVTISKLTDVVFENGYADQSHFIRNIKMFTGKKPSQLKSLK